MTTAASSSRLRGRPRSRAPPSRSSSKRRRSPATSAADRRRSTFGTALGELFFASSTHGPELGFEHDGARPAVRARGTTSSAAVERHEMLTAGRADARRAAA